MHISIAQPSLGDEELAAAQEVISSGMLAAGERVRAFEHSFASFCGATQGVATSSGTTALHAALIAAGIGPGDEVIVPTFSFFATASCVNMAGARPIFVDVDDRTYTIDPEQVTTSLTPRTKAVIGVHLYGQPFDADALQEICSGYDLVLIEDAAQAHGATWRGKRVGTLGDLACFSFYATKNMLTGEGGMVTTNSPELADQLRVIINHGQKEKYLHVRLGYNYRMTDLAAALGLVQLKKLDRFNRMRQRNAAVLDRGLSDTTLILPVVAHGASHVYHQYVVRCTDAFPLARADLIRTLQHHGIGTAVHYPLCIHQQPFYRTSEPAFLCPVGERLAGEVVSLPVHPGVTEEGMKYICDTIHEVM